MGLLEYGRLDRQRGIVVIGAGVVGTLAAWRLRRDGHAVTLIDPAPPGTGASSGNAGCLSPSSIVPLAGPDVIARVPGWLLDPNGPLSIRWSHLPRLLPWLLRFARAGRGEAVARQARALSALLGPCLPLLRPWCGAIGAGHLMAAQGSLVVYRSEASWAGDANGRDLRRAMGIAFSELDGDALRELDPALGAVAHRGLHFPDNGHSLDPQGLVAAFAAAFQAEGGIVRRAAAHGFQWRDGRLAGVETDAGTQPAELAVLAAGAFSAPLARRAGLPVPLESERGYHVMLPERAGGPRLPTVDASAKIVATPMAAGVRLTGVVELAGLKAPPDWRRARAILRLGRQLYPGLAEAEPGESGGFWMGHRPSLPDSLPAIGRAPGRPDIIFAFGHGHLGLTGAPKTAELVAELAAERLPSIDLAPFAPDRFR